MPTIESLGEPLGKDLSDNLPLLTQVVKEEQQDDLPTLTEVVAESPAEHEVIAPEAIAAPVRTFSDEEMQQLLLQLGAHLETVFTIKLNLHLEQLQQQAVEQAVNELKAELPELLRSALNPPDATP